MKSHWARAESGRQPETSRHRQIQTDGHRIQFQTEGYGKVTRIWGRGVKMFWNSIMMIVAQFCEFCEAFP